MDNLSAVNLYEIDGFDNSFKRKLNRIEEEKKFRRLNIKRFKELTKREVEIVILILCDFSNPKIADELFISPHTVKQHRKNINKKLGIHTTMQLVHFALAFNLI